MEALLRTDGASAGAAGNASGLLSPTDGASLERGAAGGSLELLLGPMFAGKTTELLRRFRRASASGKKCLLLKWAQDRRYCDSRHVVVTHDGQETEARPVERLAEAHNTIWTYDVICIDEGQFFSDLVEYADKWASSGATVVVAALDGDFRRQPFETVTSLVPLAESVTKMTAVCHACHAPAPFTLKLHAEGGCGERIDIGGKDKYLPTCRSCHDLWTVQSSVAASPIRRMSRLSISKQQSRSAGKPSRLSNAPSPLTDIKSNVVAALALR